MVTARELAQKAGCHLQIAGPSSVAITADVYRTVKHDEIRAEHQRFGPLGRQSPKLGSFPTALGSVCPTCSSYSISRVFDDSVGGQLGVDTG